MAKIVLNRDKALALQKRLNEAGGITDTQLLEYLLCNHLSGDKALELMEGCVDEFCPEWNDEEEVTP